MTTSGVDTSVQERPAEMDPADLERHRLPRVGPKLIPVAGLATIAGIWAAQRYYEQASGDWRIGLFTAAIGAGVGVAAALAALGVIVVGRRVIEFLQSPEAWPRIRRVVVQWVAAGLTISGALAGAGAGYEYATGGGSTVGSILVGVGAAFGAWLVAALLGFVVEIADSLRTLVRMRQV